MLKAYPVPGKEKSRMLCAAFIEGAPKSTHGAVFSGVKAGNFEDWIRMRASGEDWCYIDNSSFDGPSRGTQFRVAKNRLQPTGQGASDGKRFAALGIMVEPWVSRPDGYALVIDQSPDHMRYTLGLSGWSAGKIRGRTKVRPWSADKSALGATFRQDLDGARILYTHTSAAAVMAVLAGVPAICDPQCAAYGIVPWGADEDRLHWASVLADHQFTIDEMKEGLAWHTLNP